MTRSHFPRSTPPLFWICVCLASFEVGDAILCVSGGSGYFVQHSADTKKYFEIISGGLVFEGAGKTGVYLRSDSCGAALPPINGLLKRVHYSSGSSGIAPTMGCSSYYDNWLYFTDGGGGGSAPECTKGVALLNTVDYENLRALADTWNGNTFGEAIQPPPPNTAISLVADVAGTTIGNDAFWAEKCKTIPSSALFIVLDMDLVRDFFKPIDSSTTYCEMLKSNNKHQWSPNGVDWVAIEFGASGSKVNGGSVINWPRDKGRLEDKRQYLSIWGLPGSGMGGCCSSSTAAYLTYPSIVGNGANNAHWGQPFTVSYGYGDLDVNDECDPRADFCNHAKGLVCFEPEYKCRYATTTSTTSTTSATSTTTTDNQGIHCGAMDYDNVYNPGYLLLSSQYQCETVAKALNGLAGVSNIQCGGAWLANHERGGLWLSSRPQCNTVANALNGLDGVSNIQCGHNNYLRIVPDTTACKKYAAILTAYVQSTTTTTTSTTATKTSTTPSETATLVTSATDTSTAIPATTATVAVATLAVSTTPATSTDSEEGGISSGAIAGIISGGLLAIAVAALLVRTCRLQSQLATAQSRTVRRQRRGQQPPAHPQQQHVPPSPYGHLGVDAANARGIARLAAGTAAAYANQSFVGPASNTSPVYEEIPALIISTGTNAVYGNDNYDNVSAGIVLRGTSDGSAPPRQQTSDL